MIWLDKMGGCDEAMARPKKYENSQPEFRLYEDDLTKRKSVPPQVKGRQQIVSNPEARHLVGQALGEFRKAMRMPKVNSNAELIERLDQYFSMAQQREMPPTVEELSLYCGFVPSYMWDLKTGRRKGFSDSEVGFTTAEIVQKAFEVLHGTDVVLAASGKMNAVIYIWRGKNWYNEKDTQEITIAPDNGLKPPMTPEEIAKNLPDVATFKADGEVE